MNGRRFFGFFNNRQPQTWKEALPRTIAPIMAAGGFISGFTAVAIVGSLPVAFTSDSPGNNFVGSLAILGGAAVGGGSIAGVFGHLFGYGGANAFMASFPFTKNWESRFLLGPGFKPQCYLFLGTAVTIGVTSLIKFFEPWKPSIEETCHFRPSRP